MFLGEIWIKSQICTEKVEVILLKPFKFWDILGFRFGAVCKRRHSKILIFFQPQFLHMFLWSVVSGYSLGPWHILRTFLFSHWKSVTDVKLLFRFYLCLIFFSNSSLGERDFCLRMWVYFLYCEVRTLFQFLLRFKSKNVFFFECRL